MNIQVVDITDCLGEMGKKYEHIFPVYCCGERRKIDFSKTISWSMSHVVCSICGKRVYLPIRSN